MKQAISKLTILSFCILNACATLAATPLALDHQNATVLQSFLFNSSALGASNVGLQETSRYVDFNHTLHIRIKQTYQGYPVWGGDGILHLENNNNPQIALSNALTSTTMMNGMLYQQLENDLRAYTFNQEQSNQLTQLAITTYQKKIQATPAITNQQSKLIVYIDKKQIAHWAYFISFDAAPNKPKAAPERPTFIIDAITAEIYAQWNDLKTDATNGGGFGGNKKMGEVTYDGKQGDFPKLNINRDATSNTCYLQNQDVTVKDDRHNDAIISFKCSTADSQHLVYWDGDQDAVNGAYSPSNDALYEGAVIKDMYHKWYNEEVLTHNGHPMMLNMIVHADMDNAYWDSEKMVFGDGYMLFYPLTSLDVAAHEISHGFTEQHSNLAYEGQSGGLNESFSDMAGQAAEYYSTGKNDWKVGASIYWAGDALRYLDQPSKDCYRWQPAGWSCSIDDASQYNDSLDVHYSSGVFNRLFYLISTSSGWNTRKAFDVMLQANMAYWTPTATFSDAACGVIKATKDYKYDVNTVMNALKTVKVDTSHC